MMGRGGCCSGCRDAFHPPIPASGRSIDQLWQEMTDPPAAFPPCLRALCVHCAPLHSAREQGTHTAQRMRVQAPIRPLPASLSHCMKVDDGRLAQHQAGCRLACTLAAGRGWGEGAAGWSPPVPDPAAANGRRAPVGQCSADGRLSRTSGGLSAPPAAPRGRPTQPPSSRSSTTT